LFFTDGNCDVSQAENEHRALNSAFEQRKPEIANCRKQVGHCFFWALASGRCAFEGSLKLREWESDEYLSIHPARKDDA